MLRCSHSEDWCWAVVGLWFGYVTVVDKYFKKTVMILRHFVSSAVSWLLLLFTKNFKEQIENDAEVNIHLILNSQSGISFCCWCQFTSRSYITTFWMFLQIFSYTSKTSEKLYIDSQSVSDFPNCLLFDLSTRVALMTMMWNVFQVLVGSSPCFKFDYISTFFHFPKTRKAKRGRDSSH